MKMNRVWCWCVCAVALGTAAAAEPPAVFDIEEYFILAPNSEWHYVALDAVPRTSEDDFTWDILDALRDIGGGVLASQLQTLADDGDDARHNDVDYWRVDAAGNLLLCGLYKAVGSSEIPAQEVIFDDPLQVGRRGMQIGHTESHTVTASDVTGNYGGEERTGDVELAITAGYVGFVPEFDTPMGVFKDVLRLEFAIRIVSFTYYIEIPFFGRVPFTVQLNIELVAAEFFLKDGVGMIAHDKDADPLVQRLQVLDGGLVGGVKIEPDVLPTAARHWKLYQ